MHEMNFGSPLEQKKKKEEKQKLIRKFLIETILQFFFFPSLPFLS